MLKVIIKVLEKIKSFLKENWKFIIFLVVFYLFMNYQLPYSIYTPGGAINMSDRVSGENTYKEEGSLSMTYVSMVKGSIPFIGLSYIIPNWDLVPTDDITYDDASLKETVEIDKIYMKEAISNAEGVAYKTANIDYKIKSTKNVITYISSEAKTHLRYGDELTRVDGMEVKSIKDLQEYIKTKSVGDKINIDYIRDNKENTDEVTLIDMNGEVKAGLSMALINEYDTPYNIEVKTKSSESGPSGGLITALEIYNRITEEDITKGMKIMGTGTIESDGTVGEIGGVKYKLIGAVKKGAEVFICPEENYKEAASVAKKNKYNIKIISAKTFEEALLKLNNL